MNRFQQLREIITGYPLLVTSYYIHPLLCGISASCLVTNHVCLPSSASGSRASNENRWISLIYLYTVCIYLPIGSSMGETIYESNNQWKKEIHLETNRQNRMEQKQKQNRNRIELYKTEQNRIEQTRKEQNRTEKSRMKDRTT